MGLIEGRFAMQAGRAVYLYESKALPEVSMLDGQRIEYVECILFRVLTLCILTTHSSICLRLHPHVVYLI